MEAETVAEASRLFKLAMHAKKNGTNVCTVASHVDNVVCHVTIPLKSIKKNYVEND